MRNGRDSHYTTSPTRGFCKVKIGQHVKREIFGKMAQIDGRRGGEGMVSWWVKVGGVADVLEH